MDDRTLGKGRKCVPSPSAAAVGRSAVLLLAGVVFVGWLMMWAMLPTRTYSSTWAPKLAALTGFGKQGIRITVYVFPVLFVFVVACVYLHLQQQKGGDPNTQRRTRIAAAWRRPVLVRGPLGIVTGIELAVLLMFMALLVWFYYAYVTVEFSKLLRVKPGQKLWQAELEKAAKRLGSVGSLCCALLFLPVARGSSLLPLVGLTSESGIKYHVWLGNMAMAIFTAHGLCYVFFWASTDQIHLVLSSGAQSSSRFRLSLGLTWHARPTCDPDDEMGEDEGLERGRGAGFALRPRDVGDGAATHPPPDVRALLLRAPPLHPLHRVLRAPHGRHRLLLRPARRLPLRRRPVPPVPAVARPRPPRLFPPPAVRGRRAQLRQKPLFEAQSHEHALRQRPMRLAAPVAPLLGDVEQQPRAGHAQHRHQEQRRVDAEAVRDGLVPAPVRWPPRRLGRGAIQPGRRGHALLGPRLAGDDQRRHRHHAVHLRHPRVGLPERHGRNGVHAEAPPRLRLQDVGRAGHAGPPRPGLRRPLRQPQP
uniref:Ferric oxidoreductase domain-containing protein n=1 Tax=Triticum urartu TaxID=4572 RepID=A0A8R7TKZ5_TRIUA